MPKKSVVLESDIGNLGPANEFVLYFSQKADEFPKWGDMPAYRDRLLRQFWPEEPILASAICSTASRYAAFGWTLKGPPRTVGIVHRNLHAVEHGAGWMPFIIPVLLDLFTQDNGAFIEVIRTSNSEYSPAVSMNHLDSNRCVRTGRWKEPVLYYDNHNNGHILKWYQVITLEEMPSPVETMRGMQYCAVTRMLRAAQVMRDIGIYKREKIGGRFTRAIHLVGGIQKRTIDEVMKRQETTADAVGLTKYIEPAIIASLDPTATVSHEVIELASLPDHFDPEVEMRWYINQLALAFGGDYQDFAPLPGGNLGTAQQSQTLHMKARGKGPKLFMSMLEHKLNYHGVLPPTVKFSFGDQDILEDMEHAKLRSERAKERQTRIASGEITPEIARQIAADIGDLDDRYLKALNEKDVTTDVVVSDTPV